MNVCACMGPMCGDDEHTEEFVRKLVVDYAEKL